MTVVGRGAKSENADQVGAGIQTRVSKVRWRASAYIVTTDEDAGDVGDRGKRG